MPNAHSTPHSDLCMRSLVREMKATANPEFSVKSEKGGHLSSGVCTSQVFLECLQQERRDGTFPDSAAAGEAVLHGAEWNAAVLGAPPRSVPLQGCVLGRFSPLLIRAQSAGAGGSPDYCDDMPAASKVARGDCQIDVTAAKKEF
jgi:hypothetical protein